MMSKKSRNTIGYLAAVMLAFSVCVGYYYMKDYKTMGTVQAHVEGDMVLFSEDSGVYEEMITVSLTKDVEVPSSASIYYTLNGDDPSVEKTKYTGSIHLEKKKDLTIYPLKAVIYYNGEYSEIYEKTYVLCNHRNRELDVDIVCITSDRDNLYDYETGIFVAGKTYDKSLEEFDGVGLVPGNYSNRGEEWIRNAHVAMFDSEGMLRVEQDIGIGI